MKTIGTWRPATEPGTSGAGLLPGETDPEDLPPIGDAQAAIDLTPAEPADSVYLVVIERGGLLGAWLDRERAHQQARVTEAVVVTLPIDADYRQPGDAAGGAAAHNLRDITDGVLRGPDGERL